MIPPPTFFFTVAKCFRPWVPYIFHPTDGHFSYFQCFATSETTSGCVLVPLGKYNWRINPSGIAEPEDTSIDILIESVKLLPNKVIRGRLADNCRGSLGVTNV